MKHFNAVEIIVKLSIRPGSGYVRQMGERRVTLPDEVYWLASLIVALLTTFISRAWDWLFVGWGDDLALMRQAVRLLFGVYREPVY